MHPGAITWEPQIHAIVVVLLAALILPGSVYLLLSTNLGMRLGFVIAMAGLFGWLTVMALIWTIYGIGPKGDAPSWKVRETVVGDPAGAGTTALAGFPRGWKELPPDNPEVTDAQATVDADLVPPSGSGKKGLFNDSSEYLPVSAFERGGKVDYLLGLSVKHKGIPYHHETHYLVTQVQKIKPKVTVPGQAPPKSEADPTQPVVSVIMVRNLGNLRQRPLLYLIEFGALFIVSVVVLHSRDKRAMAEREQAGT